MIRRPPRSPLFPSPPLFRPPEAPQRRGRLRHAPPSGPHQDAYERDSCGSGLIASLDDAPSHWLVRTAMTSLNRLTHRGAVAADGKTGDGCGLLLKRPEGFLRDRKSVV